ncbi:MAG: hypothetical protein D3908_16385 [Candidatus Electrothrix sp. AUS4]|nr:hypothetical protein [Candidatus Electrothrix sp. AUS4]
MGLNLTPSTFHDHKAAMIHGSLRGMAVDRDAGRLPANGPGCCFLQEINTNFLQIKSLPFCISKGYPFEG